jgi:nucleotide-binding universal stress UspA family protein
MKSERILLPIDIRKCPLDVFPLVDRLASKPDTKLTLLHVVALNILAPESRIYDELAAEAREHLKRLCRENLPSVAAPIMQIRYGKVVHEILTEIEEEKADLVLLPTHGPSFAERLSSVWRRAASPVMSKGVDQIMRRAGCAIFIAASKTQFDCDWEWGRPNVASGNSKTRERERSEAVDLVSMVLSRKHFRPQYS